MTTIKVSELPVVTIPYDGSEYTLGIQNGMSVKVPALNLAAATGASLIGTIQSGTGAVSRTVASKLNDVVSVKDFGAVGNGVTDDSAAFIAALAYVETLGGGNLYIAADNYYINANITVPSGCVIVGELALTSPRAYNPNLFNYSQLLLGAGCTINLGQAAGITGCCIVRKGITYPATLATITAEWNGIGVTVLSYGAGASISNCFIGGFNIGFSSELGADKVRILNCALDCIAGIKLYNTGDGGYISLVHIWPFLSIGAVTPYIKRSGPAFDIGCNNAAYGASGIRIDSCFSFGHQTGFNLYAITSAGGSNATLVNCWSDNDISDRTDNPVGFSIVGVWQDTSIMACQASGGVKAAYLGLSNVATNDQCVQIVGCNFFNHTICGVEVTSESAVIDSCWIQNTPTAVKVNGATNVTITSNIFKSVYTAPITSTSGMLMCDNNQYVSSVAAYNSIVAGAEYTVASANIFIFPDNSNVCFITGSVNVFRIVTALWVGRQITLIASGATCTIIDGAGTYTNMAGNFVMSGQSTITFIYNGSIWIEVSRSTN